MWLLSSSAVSCKTRKNRRFSVDVWACAITHRIQHTFNVRSWREKKSKKKCLSNLAEEKRNSDERRKKNSRTHSHRCQKKSLNAGRESEREKSVKSWTINSEFMYKKHKMIQLLWFRFKIDVCCIMPSMLGNGVSFFLLRLLFGSLEKSNHRYLSYWFIVHIQAAWPWAIEIEKPVS